jgi:hypothetical protein
VRAELARIQCSLGCRFAFLFLGRPPRRPQRESWAVPYFRAVAVPPLPAMQRGQTSTVSGCIWQKSSLAMRRPLGSLYLYGIGYAISVRRPKGAQL